MSNVSTKCNREAVLSRGDAQQRLALTRVLIWAEKEAMDIGRADVAEALRHAIRTLHGGI